MQRGNKARTKSTLHGRTELHRVKLNSAGRRDSTSRLHQWWSVVAQLIKLLLSRFLFAVVFATDGYAKGALREMSYACKTRWSIFFFPVASLSADSTSSSFIFTRQQCFSRWTEGARTPEKIKGSRLGSAFHDTPAHRRRKGSATRRVRQRRRTRVRWEPEKLLPLPLPSSL